MLRWITSLFVPADRTTVAFERTAKAAEDIADALESARDELLKRLGNPASAPVEDAPRGRKSLPK